ncbi:MAG: UDP-N-acetylmuramoyl-L-alanyl-D-glutamate--2,6-diaminopimelate ligase [Arcanobacterium sp.]
MIRPEQSPTVALADIARMLNLPEIPGTVNGICADNRQVQPGDLFLALPGERVHGARFADQALAAGAVAVLTDPAGVELISGGPVLVIENVADYAGTVAAHVMADPADKLTTFAITGTNGKTTTAFMLDHVLRAAGQVTGLIGTVALRIAGEDVPAVLTTPQPADLQSMLAALVERGGESLVMEVSSHAIVQGRTKPICYSVAGFTNLTQDHLDYHSTLEEYFGAKAELFAQGNSRRAVIITDDEYGQRLYAHARKERPDSVVALSVLTEPSPQSASENSATNAHNWQVRNIDLRADGSAFTIVRAANTPDEEQLAVTTSLAGDFNIANAALAVVMAVESGLGIDRVRQALAAGNGVSPIVPGRMETISDAPRVVVDFAHNEDSLAKAIAALRPTTQGKLIVLTGSAGDRDRDKRPKMARIVAQSADHLVVTDDDPHSEDPAQIRAEVIAGIPAGYSFTEIGDRPTAITQTIYAASPNDTILIAGRGHETIQEVGGVMIEMDDRQIAREALAQRKATS